MRLPAGLLLIIGLILMPAHAMAEEAPCQKRTLRQRAVTVCTLDLTRQSARLYFKDQSGRPFGSLSSINERAHAQPGKMLFAMNAGMYHPDLSPVGLYIESGAEMKRISLAGGAGNFHMLPNGVFYLKGRSAGVMESRAFAKGKVAADFASQSGPMLVLNGRLHPKFSGNGTSAKIRNGVGVRSATSLVFVISDEPVTFTEFALMFRDDLKCRNALYFDGSISSLYAPSVRRADSFMPVGPIVAGFDR